MCSMILALDYYNCHAYITNNYYLFILILIFLLYLHKYHLYAFLRRYKVHHHLQSTCLCEFLSTYTQRSWNTTESKQPLPLVTTCSPVLFFINLPTLNFLETESWTLETTVSTYSSHLHRLHGPNTVFQAGSILAVVSLKLECLHPIPRTPLPSHHHHHYRHPLCPWGTVRELSSVWHPFI